MAIHPELSPSSVPQSQGGGRNLTLQRASEISAWTEQAAQSLRNLHISGVRDQEDQTLGSPVRRASPVLTIPLDGDHNHVEQTPTPLRLRRKVTIEEVEQHVRETARVVYRRREPIRRDSLRRREEVLKGREGSRRRQRWENDRLLNNPWAQPPSPADWQIQPTYTRHGTVPYYLASLWEAHYAAKEQARLSRRKTQTHAGVDKTPAGDMHQIPKELRLRLKHMRAAKGLLHDLEEEIRAFVKKWNEAQLMASSQPEETNRETAHTDCDEDDDEEDEIVFAGRKNGAKPPRDTQHTDRQESSDEKLVFESLVDDQSGGFGRWLVHSLASYYGLRTWSVTVGNPPRREAYVGIDPAFWKQRLQYLSSVKMATGRSIQPNDLLPSPLWVSI
ncbi:hypothetical protein VTO42DRAFT_3581 [Malbranchea cinnamomea]